MQSLKHLYFDIHYEGTASYLNSFLIPSLEKSVVYKRATGYFNVESLISVSQGLESMISRGGRMQLLVGLHDLSPELLQAQRETEGYEESTAETSSRLMDLIREIGSLQDALKLRRLETLTRLIAGRHLQVKLAKPIGIRSSHIFHVKRFVLEDENGDYVCATGSPNETLAGAEGNFEEISTFRSWEDQSGHAQELRRKFDALWSGNTPNLLVVDLADAELELIENAVTEKLVSLGIDTESELESKRKLVHALKSFVPGKLFGFEGARLYPHQEFAYLKALSRWPIRVLLADEVGLGKTLEVGSVIRYLKDVGKIESALFLAPKNVVTQLQSELSEKFGIEFLAWNSAKQRYVNSQGKQETSDLGPPGSESAPDWVIVSSQWARGSSSRPDIFEGMTKPPALLVVDEAHAARVAPPENKTAPSRLFSALERASRIIPHVVLMTATPMQIHVSEYHGLLRILGLSDTWSKLRNFELALIHQADPARVITLNDAKTLALMASEAVSQSGNSDHGQLEKLPSVDSKDLVSGATFVRRSWPDLVQDFIRLNPATQLTVRNTRTSLERFGYKFPARIFLEPEIAMPLEMSEIKAALDSYLSTAYGKVEELLSIDGKGVSRGFITSIYEQRFASSLFSLRSSLLRRKEKLEALYFDRFTDFEFDDDDFLDDEADAAELTTNGSKEITESVKSAIQNEVNYLEDVLSQVESVDLGPIEGDSKLLSAKDIIHQKTNSNQRTIVFSRYTDTLNALVQTIELDERFAGVPFGLYTGKDCWISDSSGKHEVSKSQLQNALAKGSILFVICSDAASEGINLQSASVLVNVDVPWNPGRLEQRIGRIARLGQKASSVEIANLWYPNSVEATMYGRLLERKELYDLAVGTFPELFARGIRELVSIQSGTRTSYSGDVLDKLDELREESHLKGLSMLWNETSTQESKSATIWSDWESVCSDVGLPLSNTSGLVFEGLLEGASNFGTQDSNATLFAHANEFGTWEFEILFDSANRSVTFSVSDLPKLISIAHGNRTKARAIAASSGEEWTPNHGKFSTVFAPGAEIGQYPKSDNLEKIEIGRLKVNYEG